MPQNQVSHYMKTANATPSPATVTKPPPCDISDWALLPLTCTGVPVVVLVEFPFVVPVALGEFAPVPVALPLEVELDLPVALVDAEDVVSDYGICQYMISWCLRKWMPTWAETTLAARIVRRRLEYCIVKLDMRFYREER